MAADPLSPFFCHHDDGFIRGSIHSGDLLSGTVLFLWEILEKATCDEDLLNL